MLFFILQICLKTKVHITNKTKSKLEPDFNMEVPFGNI